MASGARGEQGKLPRQVPVLGTLLGFVVVFVVLSVTLKQVFPTELDWESRIALQAATFIIGLIVGGGIGGLIQLRKQGRVAEVPRFLRHLFLSLVKFLFLLWVPMFLAAWLGERLYGRVGHSVGLVASAVLLFLVQCWLVRRSSSEKPSIPPPP
jgi:hypothetical protein